MVLDSHPLMDAAAGPSSVSRPAITFSELPRPSATSSRPSTSQPYSRRIKMRYGRLPSEESEEDIANMAYSSKEPSSKALGSRLLSTGGLNALTSRPDDSHVGTSLLSDHDGQDPNPRNDHRPHHGRAHTHDESGSSRGHEHQNSHHGHHHHRHADHKTTCLSSALSATRSLATALGSAAQQAHTNLSAFVNRHFPPPEDPCAPGACCCLAATLDLCFSPDVDSYEEGDDHHDHHEHEDSHKESDRDTPEDSHEHSHGHQHPHSHQHSHTHSHGGSHTHSHGGLQIRKPLDPQDTAPCGSHCCEKSRYFLSFKTDRQPTCHG